MQLKKNIISNQGQTQKASMNLYRPEKVSEVQGLINQSDSLLIMHKENYVGSSFIKEGSTGIVTQMLDNIVNFDRYTGKIICETGITVEELLELFLDEGYILPALGNNLDSSIGSLIAKGILSEVEWLDIITPDGINRKLSLNKGENTFHATISGYGLTGLITRACINLKKINTQIARVTRTKCKDIEEVLKILSEDKADYNYGWLDVFARGNELGRGIVYKGKYANANDLNTKLSLIPSFKLRFNLPRFLTNPVILAKISELKYKYSETTKEYYQNLKDFLFPFSDIKGKENFYGKEGFYNFSFIVPQKTGLKTIKEILEEISLNNIGSVNAKITLVNKNESSGLLSGEINSGYNISIEIPYRLGIEEILSSLEVKIVESGGFLPLSNDIQNFNYNFLKKMHPNLDKFLEILKEIDPNNKLNGLKLRGNGHE